jgi:crotonobetaine/carnitine-CoA ligase
MKTLAELLEFDFPTLVDALDFHVASQPDHVALVYGETGQALTYGEFGRLTDYVASGLTSRGVAAGDRVCVFSRNPIVSALTMAGAWKAGAIFAPINFQYQGDLLAYQLNDTSPALLVVDRDLYQHLDDVRSLLSTQFDIVEADGLESSEFAMLLEPSARPTTAIHFNSPACIIYTSGTTGRPKGVLQSHRWITHFLWIGRQLLTPDDIIHSDLPMYHVAGAHFNVSRALWVGASVVLWDRFSPSAFWERVRLYGCTTAQLLDVMIPWLMNNEPSANDRVNSLNKVHMQPLPASHHDFAQRFGVNFVTIAFGQSETGSSVMGLIVETEGDQGTPEHLYRGKSPDEIKAIYTDHDLLVLDGKSEIPHGLTGRPGPFLEVKIVDEQDQECLPGVPGEIVIRPKLPSVIFDEYLGDARATLDSVRNLWFHTGDSGICDLTGAIRYESRLVDRIRVRGENIAGAQVEDLIAQHSSVLISAVVALPSVEGNEDDIIAFVQMVDGHPFDEVALAQYCATRMPKFMRPRHIIPIDEIPRTATNKVKKSKLRDLAVRRLGRQASNAAI